ncbi:hypothetical protein NDU88_007024 [Pleurodeles waltl]|uniref:Uncharacterized protein n=1 Tax=Pleurodeles waltl TaxID=8319 RepID=A0AAV7QJF9_PLEWA|nr:hypothetical protein NDU88_007024 [Pleurodeles waltl]
MSDGLTDAGVHFFKDGDLTAPAAVVLGSLVGPSRQECGSQAEIPGRLGQHKLPAASGNIVCREACRKRRTSSA